MVHSNIYEEITIPGPRFNLPGELEIPQYATSLVLFSHGSGSSRLSPRNQFVARTLRDSGIGTFLFDLLGEEEDSVRARFDINMLTERLAYVTNWVLRKNYAKDLNIGFFGASTGAASALAAAAKFGRTVKAVVSRGGRPDLAIPVLSQVNAATLLIVGSLDTEVLQLNEQAFEYLSAPKELIIVPGASHLFEEQGTLEEVARHASGWFSAYLKKENVLKFIL
jgi:putative phosphoribosyl transferase